MPGPSSHGARSFCRLPSAVCRLVRRLPSAVCRRHDPRGEARMPDSSSAPTAMPRTDAAAEDESVNDQPTDGDLGATLDAATTGPEIATDPQTVSAPATDDPGAAPEPPPAGP